jgi:UDP-N-acetylglucosamine--N-acetylmuramyl-(pentapeptide) pyrophosphoryl-undecaprenol N-acetylglucosamine transferase
VRESIKPLLVSEGHSRSTEKFKILVFGGSQGARGINNCVRDLILKNPSWLSDCQIRLQTGSLDFATIENSLKGISNVEVKEYLKTIDQDYRWANLIVCRAGASTLAELAAAKKAAILIPFPFAADDHQRKNAEALAVQGAARCIVQKDLTPERLEKEILDFKNNPKLIEDLESSIAKIHRPGAAALMASQIKESCL